MLYGTMTCLYSQGKVLMIKKGERPNDPNSGLYTLPGGNLKEFEKGSNPTGRLESAIREVKEESGLDIVDVNPRGVILFDNSERIFPNWPDPEDFLVYLFEADKYSGELRATDEGTPIWVLERDLLDVPKNPGDGKMYEWLRDPHYFMGIIKVVGRDDLSGEGTFVDFIR